MPAQATTSPIAPAGVRILGLGLAMIAFVGGIAIWFWLALFLTSFPHQGAPWLTPTIDTGGGGLGVAWGVAIDMGLIALFGLQHSLMARPSIKALIKRVVPAALERTIFVLAALAALGLLLMLWQPIPIVIWHFETGLAYALFVAVFMLGWTILLAGSIAFDFLELMGLRQALAWWAGRPVTEPELKTPWLYSRVRHPMYLGLLLVFWSTAQMTVGHALLAAGISLYLLIGIRFEERSLEERLGVSYASYRARVPMLVPRMWPRSPSRQDPSHAPIA